MASKNPLRPMTRYITTHNAEGKAVFSDKFPEEVELDPSKGPMALDFCTEGFPVDFNGEKDLDVYSRYRAEAPGLVIYSGTVIRHVDVPPGSLSAMHRTVSLDYGVVLEGRFELILDSGETRIMEKGDVSIQRGTSHAWRNIGEGWGRMLYVLQPSKPLNMAGETLGEDLQTMKGVRAST